MDYREAVEYLYRIPKFSKKTTLDNTRRILELLGNPDKKINIYHVAGSNGKGSVCAFIESILREAGYHTGLFTSPHLVIPNERIRIDNKIIDNEEFLEGFEQVYNVIKTNEGKGIVHPSFFEFIFLMSMVIFEKNNVQYGIIEVGLGGRLDATNVIEHPKASIITSIGLEHTEILGSTIEEIAREKAGIIKTGIPVIVDGNDEKAIKEITKIAREKEAPVYIVENNNIKIEKKENKYIDFSFNSSYYDNVMLRVHFPVFYQTVNSSIAVAAMAMVEKLDRDVICLGVKKTRWEGRMELIEEGVYVDGAHNVSGVEAFVRGVKDIAVIGKRILLFGVVREKNYEKMIELLMRDNLFSKIIVTALDTDRTSRPEGIALKFKKYNADEVVVYDNVRDAYEYAYEQKTDKDILYCAGSLYLIGDIKRLNGGKK